MILGSFFWGNFLPGMFFWGNLFGEVFSWGNYDFGEIFSRDILNLGKFFRGSFFLGKLWFWGNFFWGHFFGEFLAGEIKKNDACYFKREWYIRSVLFWVKKSILYCKPHHCENNKYVSSKENIAEDIILFWNNTHQ